MSEKRALMAMAESATMRVQVSQTAPAGDLKAYLEEARCVVQVLDPHTLEISIPRAPSRAQALRELTVYLAAWRTMKPGVDALLVD
jgi:hypothetical protein